MFILDKDAVIYLLLGGKKSLLGRNALLLLWAALHCLLSTKP